MATRIPVASGGQPDNYGFNLANVSAVNRLNTTDNNVSSASSGSSVANTSGTQTSSQTQSGVEVVDSSTQNMTSANQRLLQNLIQQLLGGGTTEMRQQAAIRDAEREQVGNIRSAFSKEAAFGDAQGLISQQMRRALEQMLPSINRAAEDAGSSGGALRALLLQDAANKAAESSSALGVQTAANYGGIAANLSQVMERLTAIDPQATEMLVNALNVSKGAIQNTTGTKTTSGTTSGVTNTSQTQSQITNENKNVSTDFAPFGSRPVVSTAPIYFGPSAPDTVSGGGVDMQTQSLRELANSMNTSGWGDYAF